MFELQSIAGFFENGGPFMEVILALFAVALAIMVERFWVLYVSRRGGGGIRDEGLMDRLAYLVRNGHTREQIRREGKDGNLLTRMTARILPHRTEDRMQLRNAADTAVLEESSRVTRRLSYLPMLANAAVLLGLLGTIFELRDAFGGGAAASVGQAELLSSEIAIALNPTALGLMVAVLTLVGYTLLESRAESVLDAVDAFALQVVNALIDTLPEEPGRSDTSDPGNSTGGDRSSGSGDRERRHVATGD